MKKRRSGIIDSYNRFLRCIMAKTVKMQDIAEKLGVSTMTVSEKKELLIIPITGPKIT